MAKKDIMSSIGNLAATYGASVFAIIEALITILDSLAIAPVERAKVYIIIDALRDVANEIMNEPVPAKVIIEKKDIEEAVAKVVAKLLNEVVTKAVSEALTAEKVSDNITATEDQGATDAGK